MNKLNKYHSYRVHHIVWADDTRKDLRDDYTIQVHERDIQRGMRTAVYQLQKAKECRIALCVCSYTSKTHAENLKHDFDTMLSKKFGDSTENPV